MACVAHTPPEVGVIVAASPASENRPSFRAVSRTAAHFVDGAGGLDFHCFKHSIRVRFTLQTARVRFARSNALTFAYRKGDRLLPVTHHVRQFPGGVHRLGARTIVFTYRNASNCGVPHGPPLCKTSEYGLFIADAAGRVRRIDPPVNNGGNNY